MRMPSRARAHRRPPPRLRIVCTRNSSSRGVLFSGLGDGLDLEVEGDEAEDEALEVLNQVVEEAEALRVGAVLHIQHTRDLRAREGDVL